MKIKDINSHFRLKSNPNFIDNIMLSPSYKLSDINQLKINAELLGNSEITLKASIPFDGKLIVTRSGEKNPLPLLSANIKSGYFITSIPFSRHDETQTLRCVLLSKEKKLSLLVELIQAEIPALIFIN